MGPLTMTQYVLFGCGGFALEVAEYLRDLNFEYNHTEEVTIVSDVVSDSNLKFSDLCSILGYSPVFHDTPSTVQKVSEKKALICLGSPEDRHRNFLRLKRLGFCFGTIVHKTAWVAQSAQIDEGVIICPFAFIGAMANVRANSVVNAHATVGHHVNVGISAVLSPHCDLNGQSACGGVSFVGAGAILDPNAVIGDYSKVASGAVVKRKFGDGYLLAGNPANGRQMFEIGAVEAEK